MNAKLKLFDIQGLDHVSFWPLAPAWWMLFALLAIGSLAGVIGYFFLQKRRAHWRRQMLTALKRLELNLNSENSKATATQLAVILRRLAMRKFSRNECAALKGQGWLDWLKVHDPKKFNWAEARFLIEAPYCGDARVFPVAPIQSALKAAKGWVK